MFGWSIWFEWEMASKLRTCFMCWNLSGFNCVNHHNGRNRVVRVSFPASCEMRHRATFRFDNRPLLILLHALLELKVWNSMRSCIIVCGSSQHKRQQIKPSAEGGLRQNQDEEDDAAEVSLNNDDSVENLNDATAPLVSSPFYAWFF